MGVKKVKRMTGEHSLNGSHCETTGKKIYVDKKSARQVRNRLTGGLSIFPCGTHYHLGHHGDLQRYEHRRAHE